MNVGVHRVRGGVSIDQLPLVDPPHPILVEAPRRDVLQERHSLGRERVQQGSRGTFSDNALVKIRLESVVHLVQDPFLERRSSVGEQLSDVF
jgi:hypothetical protein